MIYCRTLTTELYKIWTYCGNVISLVRKLIRWWIIVSIVSHNITELNDNSLKWRHMGAISSQVTGGWIAYSSVCSGVDQSKHQRSISLAFVREIYRWPVNSPCKGPVTRKIIQFDHFIMYYIEIKYKALRIYFNDPNRVPTPSTDMSFRISK